MTETQMYTPLEVAVALSLYAYNVSGGERAQKLYDHFEGRCMEIGDMVVSLVTSPCYVVTEFPMPTAAIYVQHALEKYGEEAINRVKINLGGGEPS